MRNILEGYRYREFGPVRTNRVGSWINLGFFRIGCTHPAISPSAAPKLTTEKALITKLGSMGACLSPKQKERSTWSFSMGVSECPFNDKDFSETVKLVRISSGMFLPPVYLMMSRSSIIGTPLKITLND